MVPPAVIPSRLRAHTAAGLIREPQADAIAALAEQTARRWQFAHGDLTARNVLRDSQGQLVLIDWEWAGLYPCGYERAFLSLSLIDVPGARDQVERSVPAGQEGTFLLSAILVQLLHLHLWQHPRSRDAGSPNPYLANHETTLKELLRQAAPRILV